MAIVYDDDLKIDKKVPQAKTQRELIRKALDAGETLTAMDAINRFRCTKLATRVSELRRMGYPVVIWMEKNENTGKRYAKYRKGDGDYKLLDKVPYQKSNKPTYIYVVQNNHDQIGVKASFRTIESARQYITECPDSLFCEITKILLED